MRYAIADIHGCCKTFHALIEKLRLKGSDSLYLLGDYIDRGPDSKGVLDTIMNLDCKVVSLMGNHEDMWLRASVEMDDPLQGDANINLWMENGGQATLKSFAGTDTKPYLAFLRDLPLFLELDDFYLVHAEFDFSLPDPFGDAGIPSMLWSRGKPYHGKKPVLCGHSILTLEQIQAGLQTNRINIDNGCFFVDRVGCHNLLAYCLHDGQLYIQENIEDPSWVSYFQEPIHARLAFKKDDLVMTEALSEEIMQLIENLREGETDSESFDALPERRKWHHFWEMARSKAKKVS
ncbi:MAG: metallophosphoesterase [Deltaproteobacteria bacterium]|nr:metallophosphoesterase [Deltaproteobacteria bacterium]